MHNELPATANASIAAFDIEGFKGLYASFDSTMVKRLPDFYGKLVNFKDPVHELKGLDELRNYFSSFLSPGMQCRFVYTNQLVGAGQAFLQWQMHYRHPRLEDGRELILNGASVVKFTSHVFYHEDFYDMGAMIYQHIPVLGWAVKKINARIGGAS